MNRYRRLAGAALGIALMAGAAGYLVGQWWYGPAALSPSPVTERLIDATFDDLTGQPRRISEWSGRPLVLNFWATWCPPCLEEIPLFIEMQQRFAGAVQFVGVALEEPAPVQQFARRFNINYPLLIAPREGFALMDRYGNPRNVLPFTVILAADGRIVERHAGAYRRTQLEAALKRAGLDSEKAASAK